MKYDRANLAGMMDFVLLDAKAGEAQIEQLCDMAKQCGAYCVVVNSCFVRLASKLLAGSNIRISAAISYPYGAMSTFSKVAETANAINDGADEIDLVMNIGMLLAGKYNYVMDEITMVVGTAKGKNVKVCCENGFLTDEQKMVACEIAAKSGAAFVCTSTGFEECGATVSDVSLMCRTVGGAVRVRAQGNINTRQDVIVMLEAGAERIASMNYESIMNELD